MRQKPKRLIKPLSDESAPTERHLFAFSRQFSYNSDKIKIFLVLKFYALSEGANSTKNNKIVFTESHSSFLNRLRIKGGAVQELFGAIKL